ncbi:MAG: hypothetical protein ACJ76B_05715 [Solirubrobacterales bacterium]
MAAKAKTNQQKAKVAEVEPGTIDELVRIIVLQLRYAGAPQGTLVHDLSKLGLEPARIAQLLGAKASTVRQQKTEKRPTWPQKAGSK